MIRTILCAALAVSGVLAADLATAQSPDVPSLITPVTTKAGIAGDMPEGVRHINYNSALARRLSPGSPVLVALPDGTNVTLNFEKRKRNPSGSVTWVGQLAGYSQSYKAIITDDGEHVFGRILTPDGVYLLRTIDGVQQLLNPRAAGLEELHLGNDEAVPPAPSSRSADQRAAKSTPPAENSGHDEMATVDVLLAYSTGLATQLGGGLQARLDYLIATANQAYENSEIYLRIRVVHSVEIDFSDTETTNGYTLQGMTPNYIWTPTPPSLLVLPELRNTYGADLVTFVRRFQHPEQASCGTAWVLGFNNAGTVNGEEAFGYSVVSDGIDNGYFCDDFTLAHELGHNMGSTHDRPNAGDPGVFPYSYGYGDSGEFGTVMSYISPAIAVFSNPNLDCFGQPCGIAHPDAASADNARSINNTRFEIAAFRATEVPESCTPEETLTLENELVSGVVTETACAIVAGPSYTVSSTADVTFNATESITLRPGFQVAIGGRFAASVDPMLEP
ncbi:MAG TPA: zinc-dependent metalloprotease family protein [Cellvibrionaceae bacterium]